MKNPVNLTLLAIKVAMYEKLQKSIEADKTLLKSYDKAEYKTQYLNIKIVNKIRTTLIKENVQEVAEKYKIDMNTLTKTTNYKECTITTTAKADKEAEKAYKLLEANANRNVAMAASGLADRK